MKCSECIHWGPSSQWVSEARKAWRDCDNPDRRAVSTGYDHFGSDLSCAPDFGCVQFEPLDPSGNTGA
jgi:hypothetical protein